METIIKLWYIFDELLSNEEKIILHFVNKNMSKLNKKIKFNINNIVYYSYYDLLKYCNQIGFKYNQETMKNLNFNHE